ncbi:MAG: Ig-like domain-containing protein [Candidatus Woykebacteria bacterium]
MKRVKMRALDLLKQYRKSINPPYRRRDLSSIIGTIFILIAIPATVLLIIQGVRLLTRAAGETNIWLEAESGNLTAPMTAVSDSTASGGKYITTTVTNTAFEGDKVAQVGQVLQAQSWDFVEGFDIDPASPQSAYFYPNWDFAVHTRDEYAWITPDSMKAMHGPDCGPPPATHTFTDWKDAVYFCKNHMMSAIIGEGYGVLYFTPNQMVDFSSGEAVIQFDVSTLRTSGRDWWDLYIIPWDDLVKLPLDGELPDLAGEPRNAVKAEIGTYSGGTNLGVDIIRNFSTEDLEACWWCTYESFLTPSPKQRETFELRVSKTHVKFGMPGYNEYWVDENIPALSWSRGVILLGHHSYNPSKADCGNNSDPSLAGVSCGDANTWHWDNFRISKAVPFTIIHSDRRYVSDDTTNQVNFASPAPSGSNLYFAANSNASSGPFLEVSFDGGSSWSAAKKQATSKNCDHQYCAAASYWNPIPVGKTSVKFRSPDSNWIVNDVSIFSPAVPDGEPPPPPPTDTTAPSVTITSPTNGATVSGNVNFQVTANDASGIDQATWIVDGVSVGSSMSHAGPGEDEHFTFTWNSTQVFDGSHTLAVEVIDNVGNKTTKSVTATTNNGNPKLPTNTGSVSMPFNVTESGTYTVWTRVFAPNASSDSYWLQIDNLPGIKVGDGAISFGSWQWINHKNGGLTNKIEVDLTSGTHTLKIIGREAGTRIDKVLITNKTGFVPSGISGDEDPPLVSITSPSPNQSVFGMVDVQINASDNSAVEEVELFVDGSSIGTSTSATAGVYTIDWDSTNVSDGTHTLVAKATDSLGNVGTSTGVTVSVDNLSNDNTFVGSYYNNTGFTSLAFTRSDADIDFDWGNGSPGPSVSSDTFSVRWSGNFDFEGATYTFTATTDDGMRVYVDGNIIIDQWQDQGATTYTADRTLTAGKHNVLVEYYENAGQAVARLGWSIKGTGGPTPATGFNRVRWQGNDWYLHGVNLPWYNYSCDFGCGSNGGVTNSTVNSRLNQEFAALKAANTHFVRWWMFPGNDPWQISESGGLPSGINQAVYADIDEALRLAEQYDIYYNFTLFGSPNATKNWTGTTSARQALADTLSALFKRYANHPRIVIWEVFNEPEWAIQNNEIAASEVQDTVSRIADAVHANTNAYVTVGSAHAGDLDLWKGIVDIYDAHFYDWMSGDLCIVCRTYDDYKQQFGLDAPMLVGELYVDPPSIDALTRYETLYVNGYAGAWGWSLLSDRTNDQFEVEKDKLKSFADNHTDIGPRSGGSTPPPGNAGDINGDGRVDIFDASILASRWGTNDPDADLNGNGVVDIFDASILASNWGQ